MSNDCPLREEKMADVFDLPLGSTPFTVSGDNLVSLYEGEEGRWFFAPRVLKMSQNSQGQPRFVMIRQRVHAPEGGGLNTVGGVLGAQLDFDLVLTPALIQQWTDAIKQLNPGLAVKEFIPLSLNNGTMTIDNLTNFVPPEDLPLYKNREVGSSGDVGIAIRLNAAGADFFFEALGAGATSLGIMVRVDFKFNRLYPGGKFLIQADILKIYDFFSL